MSLPPVISVSPTVRQIGPLISVEPQYTITLTTRLGEMQLAMGVSGGPRGHIGPEGPEGPPGPPGEGVQADPGDFTLLFENQLI